MSRYLEAAMSEPFTCYSVMGGNAVVIREQANVDNDQVLATQRARFQNFNLMEVATDRLLAKRAADNVVEKKWILPSDDTEQIGSKFAIPNFSAYVCVCC